MTNEVYPCCSFSIHNDKFVLGNIYSNSIFDIWNGAMISLIREKIKEGLFNAFLQCKICKDSYYKYS
ncbi:MAG: SPASM domain-containing protein [Nitrospirae bacterium]|nr:SPASM domain-containing protein [Nitrospirota bacterium]